jgi:hypothetical protein
MEFTLTRIKVGRSDYSRPDLRFSVGGGIMRQPREAERDRLYRKIGRLQVEVDWLKKRPGISDKRRGESTAGQIVGNYKTCKDDIFSIDPYLTIVSGVTAVSGRGLTRYLSTPRR